MASVFVGLIVTKSLYNYRIRQKKSRQPYKNVRKFWIFFSDLAEKI
jgi:hypothetical protein